MSIRKTKGNDVQVNFDIKDENGNILSLSSFSDYWVKTFSESNKEIREYRTGNDKETGKLYEVDSQNLRMYVETRDSDTYSTIKVVLYGQISETELNDDNWDFRKEIEVIVFR